MNLFEIITQSDLNDAIDLLLNNYHREINLNIDDSSNDYCGLNFDLSEGVDAGNEVIFNDGDELHITITNQRLALMGYTIRFFYYQLNKGDYTGTKSYDDLQSFDVKLDEDTISVPFTDNQVYLQKDFTLILLKDIGYRLLLNASSTNVDYGDDVVLNADYTLGSVPVEDAEVEFYKGETLIDTMDTDEDGLATLTVSDLGIGTYNFSCVSSDDVYSNMVGITVNKLVPTISLVADKSEVLSGESYTLSGVLSVGSGVSVKLYNGQTLIDTLTTGTNGEFTKTITSTDIGINTFRAVFDGGSIYEGVTSSNVNVFVVSDNYIELKITDSSFSTYSSTPFGYTGNILTNWGDGTFTEYNGGRLTHTYDDSDDYTIKVYGNITTFNANCFWRKLSLKCVMIPKSVTSIGSSCFAGCTNLNTLYLNWNTSDTIVTYTQNTFSVISTVKFSIPSNTTQLYTAKGYASDRLVER